MQDLVIIGAGGHAKVLIDIAEAGNEYRVSYLVDAGKAGEKLLGYPINAEFSENASKNFVIGIGDNKARAKAFAKMILLGWQPISLIHPASIISKHCQIGQGSVIAAGAVINTEARISHNCIVNTAATVDHDCDIRAHVHIAPGSHLAGSVSVDEGAFLGIGTVVMPKCTIGAWAIVGAGAVVKNNVSTGDTVAGVPAKVIYPETNLSLSEA